MAEQVPVSDGSGAPQEGSSLSAPELSDSVSGEEQAPADSNN